MLRIVIITPILASGHNVLIEDVDCEDGTCNAEESFLSIRKFAPSLSTSLAQAQTNTPSTLSLDNNTMLDLSAGMYTDDNTNENIPKTGSNPTSSSTYQANSGICTDQLRQSQELNKKLFLELLKYNATLREEYEKMTRTSVDYPLGGYVQDYAVMMDALYHARKATFGKNQTANCFWQGQSVQWIDVVARIYAAQNGKKCDPTSSTDYCQMQGNTTNLCSTLKAAGTIVCKTATSCRCPGKVTPMVGTMVSKCCRKNGQSKKCKVSYHSSTELVEFKYLQLSTADPTSVNCAQYVNSDDANGLGCMYYSQGDCHRKLNVNDNGSVICKQRKLGKEWWWGSQGVKKINAYLDSKADKITGVDVRALDVTTVTGMFGSKWGVGLFMMRLKDADASGSVNPVYGNCPPDPNATRCTSTQLRNLLSGAGTQYVVAFAGETDPAAKWMSGMDWIVEDNFFLISSFLEARAIINQWAFDVGRAGKPHGCRAGCNWVNVYVGHQGGAMFTEEIFTDALQNPATPSGLSMPAQTMGIPQKTGGITQMQNSELTPSSSATDTGSQWNSMNTKVAEKSESDLMVLGSAMQCMTTISLTNPFGCWIKSFYDIIQVLIQDIYSNVMLEAPGHCTLQVTPYSDCGNDAVALDRPRPFRITFNAYSRLGLAQAFDSTISQDMSGVYNMFSGSDPQNTMQNVNDLLNSPIAKYFRGERDDANQPTNTRDFNFHGAGDFLSGCVGFARTIQVPVKNMGLDVGGGNQTAYNQEQKQNPWIKYYNDIQNMDLDYLMFQNTSLPRAHSCCCMIFAVATGGNPGMFAEFNDVFQSVNATYDALAKTGIHSDDGSSFLQGGTDDHLELAKKYANLFQEQCANVDCSQ